MNAPKETDLFLSSLKLLFLKASSDVSEAGKLSLWTLARELSFFWEQEEKSLSVWGESLYWLSCLILWKGQWLILQEPTPSVFIEPVSLPEKKVKPISGKVKLPKTSVKEKVNSLVMYLEHKTFEALSLHCKPKIVQEKLDVTQLEELYKNVNREKGRKKNLAHITLLTGSSAEKGALPDNWDQFLISWGEEKSINSYLADLEKGQQVAVFQDLLFRQKKGELFLSQGEPNAPIYLKRLEQSVASYG